ncbi:MAG: translation initiation factor IF-2 [Chitinivibrionales bacterium]|nr:translation initiation factor IF-2 [Chitinivibrionales bacterium]MBD3395492.1 translation initiation factor IF-2 [Chitinivibrionales bacterium]
MPGRKRRTAENPPMPIRMRATAKKPSRKVKKRSAIRSGHHRKIRTRSAHSRRGRHMAKEKVYKLAQEFKVSSEALVQMLRGMGIPVKSHMSTVDEKVRAELKKKFEQERASIKKQYQRKKQMLTKAREDLLAKAEKAGAAAEAEAKAAEAKPKEAAAPTRRRPPGPRGPRPRGHRSVAGAPKEDGIVVSESPPPITQSTEQKRPAAAPQRKGRRRGGRRREPAPEVDQIQTKANIRKTLAKIGAGTARRKYKKEAKADDQAEAEEKKVLHVSEFVTANELANMMGVKASEVIAKCLEMGMFVTINQRLDFETIELLADEFGFAAQLMSEYAVEEDEEEEDQEQVQGEAVARAPVVTVMGHVDHGKTSLLDHIRKTNVIAGESGGITQHIAAYEVETKHGKVTFLDTPGHEAFTAMRARGSQITDVIVLVVAADSGVMPQTKEAIDHARAAGVPVVVAINKIDLPTASIDKVKGELAQNDVVVEDYGGQVSCVQISAKTGEGVDKLLEILALETEILELKATPEGRASGVVIEAELDRGKGSVATVLVQRGTLRAGDPFVTGIHHGRVRDLYNERGVSVDSVGPSQPVVVLGLSGTPQAGDSFRVTGDEKEAREISGRRRLAQREREIRRIGSVSLDHLYEQIQAGNVQTLNLIIKGDVDGSVEALATSLEKLSTPEIQVRVIHKSVGAIKETDVNLAAASNALIVGFHLSPNSKIRELARQQGVDIRTYRIIYEAVDAVRNAMEGMLAPEIKENVLATIEVREVFKISKIGQVAGCFVTSGTVTRGARARVIRDDIEVADTRIATLKRHQDDAREVQNNYECGLTLEKFSDYRPGDRIETFEEIEIARKLSA